MPENIFEHTTSLEGLTCKPLAILSETISPQEMSRARGGDGDPFDTKYGDSNYDPGTIGSKAPGQIAPGSNEQCDIGCTQPCCDQGQDQDPQNLAFPTVGGGGGGGGGLVGPIVGGGGGGGGTGEDGDAEDSSLWDDIWDWLTGDEDEDEDDNGSGLDGMEGDFDPSQDEMLV